MERALGACAWACVCGVVAAAETPQTPQQACRTLEEALCEETTLLARVVDKASAEALVPELRDCLERLAAMRGTDEPALWSYIDNTPDAKTRMVDVMERLARQFNRLEREGFFDCAELADALAPQLQNPVE